MNMKILNVFVLVVFTPFSLCSSYSMDMNDENTKRNWRNSLNVYDNNEIIVIDVDSWLENTSKSINGENEIRIRSKFDKQPSPVEQNIASARFTIIYKGSEEVFKYHITDLDKIFVSGLNSFTDDNIIFPISFIDGPRPSGGEINRIQKERINTLIGKNLVPSGTHSEESILLYINIILSNVIKSIGSDFTIFGTILEISSFKDPCSDVCVPVLKEFMQNLCNILNEKIQGKIPNVQVANNLENLVLLSGKKNHMSSREGMDIKEEIVKLNFLAPTNRIFSRNQ